MRRRVHDKHYKTVGREAPELKRVEGRMAAVKREATQPSWRSGGSYQNPPPSTPEA